MKKMYYALASCAFSTIVYGSSLIMLSSCVNEDYDLNKDIDAEMNLGGTITVPVGTVKPIILGDILDADEIDEIEQLSDGSYRLSVSEEETYDFEGIEPVTVDAISKTKSISTKFEIPNFPAPSISTKAASRITVPQTIFNAEISTEANIAPDEVISLPAEIEEIDKMTFSNDVNLTFEVAINLNGIDASVSFEDLSIEFPKFLKFNDARVNSSNVIMLNEAFSKIGNIYKYTTTLNVSELDFTSYPNMIVGEGENKTLNLSDKAKIEGAITMTPNNTIGGSVDLNFNADVTFAISQMEIAKVYGIVSPDFEIEDEEIDMSEIYEDFDGELTVTFVDPVLKLGVENPLDIPININKLKIQPYKADAELKAIELKTPIHIAAAQEGVAASTDVEIRGEAYNGGNSDVQYVEIANLKNILNGMPDKIIVSYDIAVDKSTTHMVDLSKSSHAIKFNYGIEMPLSFEEFSFNFTESFSDLGTELTEAFEYLSTFEIDVTIDNGLPIELSIPSIVPLDADGNKLTGLGSFIKNGKIAANGKSTLTLSVSDNAEGDISKLDGLEVEMAAVANTKNGGASLNANQTITIGLATRIANGVHITGEIE